MSTEEPADRDVTPPAGSSSDGGSIAPHTAIPAHDTGTDTSAGDASDADFPRGRPGPRFDRQSWFLRGFAAATGVAVVALLGWTVIQVSSELVLVALALFIAVGLEPAVSWLHRRRLPRWAAVTSVLLIGLGAVAGFLATAIPVVVAQATQFAQELPGYLQSAPGRESLLGRIDNRVHFQQALEQLVTSDNGATVVGAGEAVVNGLVSTVVVVALIAYFLSDFPRLRRTAYRLVPASRRTRVILLGDEILAKVGGYVLGSLVLALIAGSATLIWLLILGVSYALLLAILVALLDLIPVLGSILGGIAVSLVTLTVSTPAALATVGFFIAYRLLEDYVLLPRIIGRTVQVPALITLIAVVLGAALLGPVGAIMSIPLAAAALLILREVLIPQLDRG